MTIDDLREPPKASSRPHLLAFFARHPAHRILAKFVSARKERERDREREKRESNADQIAQILFKCGMKIDGASAYEAPGRPL